MTNARPSITSVSATQRKGRTQRPPKSNGQLSYARLCLLASRIYTPKEKEPGKAQTRAKTLKRPSDLAMLLQKRRIINHACPAQKVAQKTIPSVFIHPCTSPPASMYPPPFIFPPPKAPQSLSTPGPGQTEGQSCEAGTGPRCGGHDEQCSRASSRSDRAGRHG